MWRSICLRGAGFPASGVLDLAAPGTALALDRMLDQEPMLKANTAAAMAAVEAEIGVTPRNDPRRAAVIAHLRRLRAGAAVEPASELSSHAAAAVTARSGSPGDDYADKPAGGAARAQHRGMSLRTALLHPPMRRRNVSPA